MLLIEHVAQLFTAVTGSLDVRDEPDRFTQPRSATYDDGPNENRLSFWGLSFRIIG